MATDEFKNTLPEYLKQKDETGFQIGAQYPLSHPRLILSVDGTGLADRLGVKPLDVLVSLAGRPTQSVIQFKEAIKEHTGQQVKIVVSRLGREVILDVKIPSELPRTTAGR